VIPSSGDPASARMRPSDAYLDLIADTLEGLESSARAQFLQRLFLSLAHIEVSENQAIPLWDEVLARKTFLSERTESSISLHTALIDVLTNAGKVRVPILLEYDELKNLLRTAATDPLTGLQNRRLFDETFDKELNRARRYAHPLSLVTLDLHRFKEVNDKYGHPRGDEVLKAAAATFKKALRTSDSAFRIGGDEFALLLPQTDSAQASALSRRIGIVFAETLRPFKLEISVAIDHGVATFPQDGDQPVQLIRVSDERLYHSKHANHRKAVPESAATGPVADASVDVTVDIPGQTAGIDSPVPLPSVAPVEPAVSQPPAPISAASAAISSVAEPAPVQPPPAPQIEFAAPPPVPEPEVSPLQKSQPIFPVAAPEPQLYAVPRKAERVSMAGTNAYAVLGDESSNRARVVDLGFGGVALDFPSVEGLSDTLFAVLHVPILPPVRVNLKRLWTRQLNEDTFRVGCCFIS
jgi:diguanylate cyclase (GGDEF)-like protein